MALLPWGKRWLWCRDANLNTFTLQINGRIDGVRISADDGHGIGLRRGDVDLAGGSTAGSRNEGWVQRSRNGDGSRHRIRGEADDRNGAVMLIEDIGPRVRDILQNRHHKGIDTHRNRGEHLTEPYGVNRVIDVAAGVGRQS